MAEKIPNRINKYKIREVLGSGGAGVVYLGSRDDGEFDKLVAIKLLKDDLHHSEYLASRFRIEKNILASMHHPNIAVLLDAGKDDATDQMYFIMEYIDGLQIDDYCRINQLTITQKLGLFKQLCAGVQYAHENLIIHRDIKPGNVLVTKEGQVKILDFGIAKLVDDQQVNSNITSMHTPYTIHYASPEQVQNKNLTIGTDIFSLGVVLYEMVTGERLYAGKNTKEEIISAIVDQSPNPPSKIIPKEMASTGYEETIVEGTERPGTSQVSRQVEKMTSITRDLDAIIAMALSKSPEDRYRSVGDFVDDIDAYVNGFPVKASHPRPLYRLKKLVLRNKLVSLAISFSFIVTILFLKTTIDRSRELEQVAKRNREVGSFFTSLFAELDPYQVNSKELSTAQALDRAYDKILSAFSDAEDIRIHILSDAGNIFLNLGQYDRAERLISEAADLLSRTDSDQDLKLHINIQKMRLATNRDRFEESRGLQKSLLKNYSHLFTETSAQRVWLAVAAANNEIKAGRPQEAIGFLEAVPKNSLDSQDANNKILFLNTLVESYSMASKNLEAIENSQKLLDLIDRNPQFTSYRPAALSGLAQSYIHEDRYAEAIEVGLEAVKIAQQIFGSKHPSLAAAYQKLGTAYWFKGDFKEAIDSLNSNLNVNRAMYGDIHSQVAISLANIALIHSDMAEYDEARKLFQQSLDIRRQTTGRFQIGYAVTLANMATTYARERKFDKSIVLQKEAIAIDLKILGDLHTNTLKHQQDLGIDLMESGKYEEGYAIAKEVHQKTVKKFGKEHLKAAWSGSTVARALIKLARYDEAKPIAEEARQTFKSQMGGTHFELPNFTSRLAEIALLTNDHDKAIELCMGMIKNIELNKGKTYVSKGFSLKCLGDSYAAKNQTQLAVKYYREFKKVVGEKRIANYPKVIKFLSDEGKIAN